MRNAGSVKVENEYSFQIFLRTSSLVHIKIIRQLALVIYERIFDSVRLVETSLKFAENNNLAASGRAE